MNTKNIKTDSNADKINKFSVLDEKIFTECTYGSEDVIAELSPQVERNVSRHNSMKWAGFDYLNNQQSGRVGNAFLPTIIHS